MTYRRRVTVGRALRISLWAEIALFTVLAASGLWLTRYYRPTAARVSPFDNGGLSASVVWAARVRDLHRFSGSLFIWIALGVLALCVVRALNDKTAPRSRLWILGAAFAIVAWGTSFTGFLLPWDALALRAIRLNEHINGMWSAAFSDNIRFVLIDSHEISQSLLRNWFLTHAFVLPPWLLAGLSLLRRRSTKD
jgi:quinol-cytochrome oxidoreductase complex cytochrome b subunit